MLLHSAGKEISESNVENILNAAGLEIDSIRVKALVASLSEVDIEEVLKTPSLTAVPTVASEAPIPVAEEKKAEPVKAEEKKAEAAEEKKPEPAKAEEKPVEKKAELMKAPAEEKPKE